MRIWVRRLLTGVALVLPALLVYAWQTRDLLPTHERLPAPAFVLQDLQGQPFDSSALAGRPAVLYFFAPWCGICAASAPQLRWFAAAFQESTPLVLVALDYESPAAVSAYAARHRLTVPVLLGNSDLGAAYRIRGYPTYYVLDAEGRIAGRDFGVSTVIGLWWRTRGLGA